MPLYKKEIVNPSSTAPLKLATYVIDARQQSSFLIQRELGQHIIDIERFKRTRGHFEWGSKVNESMVGMGKPAGIYVSYSMRPCACLGVLRDNAINHEISK